MKKSKKLSEYADLMKEWHAEKNDGLDPNNITCGSDRKVWWICELGHEWPATVYNRVHNHSNCPYCAGQRVIPGVNDLQSQFPEAAALWSPKNTLKASQVCAKTTHKYLWVCPQGHEWKASVHNCARMSGCPYCNHKKVIPGETDLESRFPAIAKQWDYDANSHLTPRDVFPYSRRAVGWKCEKVINGKKRLNIESRILNAPFVPEKSSFPG